MASIGHVAVGMAAARQYRRGQRPRWTLLTSMVVWSFVSLLPDADVIGFRFGVAYAAPWGHRGATHSLAFAVVLGPWNPIPVAPIGRAFFTHVGLSVAIREALLFAPVFAFALWPRKTSD